MSNPLRFVRAVLGDHAALNIDTCTAAASAVMDCIGTGERTEECSVALFRVVRPNMHSMVFCGADTVES